MNEVVYYTMKYYSDIKKEKNLTICDSMDGPQGHYTKQNKEIKTNAT